MTNSCIERNHESPGKYKSGYNEIVFHPFRITVVAMLWEPWRSCTLLVGMQLVPLPWQTVQAFLKKIKNMTQEIHLRISFQELQLGP